MHRFFEILPGTLAWGTLILVIVFSRVLPSFVSVFIILFDIYWLLKTIYLSLHLRATFTAMKENLKVNWLEKIKQSANRGAQITVDKRLAISDWQEIYHLIIFPTYREPHEVVRESFVTLLATNYPKDKCIVVLATEEKGGEEAQEIAKKIEQEFGGAFFKFLVTIHPADLPGEIPGKGSNETWAAKEARRLIIDPLIEGETQTFRAEALGGAASLVSEGFAAPRGSGREPLERANRGSARNVGGLSYRNILVSVFDVDTQVFPEYFGRLTYVFLTSEKPLRAIYQPIPLFTNNIYRAPALARVVSFSATFWQMMQQSRPERLTSFSSQSIPFQVLVDIGFWNTDIVSEDSRIFWQCFLHYDGDFRVEPLLYPVSMDANVAPTFWGTMKNIYKQQRRWGWGVENIPYMLDGFRKNPRISSAKKRYWTFNVLEGFHSWATNSLMIFVLGWLPLVLGGRNFNYTLLSYSLPQVTRYIVSISMIGVMSSAVLAILLLPPRPSWFKPKHYLVYFLEWILIPITINVFGALPGLEAQTRLMLGGKWRLGFWVTPKHRNHTKTA